MSYLEAYSPPDSPSSSILKLGTYHINSLLTGDATIDAVPRSRSNNNQSNSWVNATSHSIPLKTLSTRDAPRLLSVSQARQEVATNSQLENLSDRRASNNLRASIAQLEFLIHEAARLAENAYAQEDQQNTNDPEPTSHIKLIEHDQSEVDSDQILQEVEEDKKTLSRRPPSLSAVQSSTESVRSFMSLPVVKPVQLLPPILTGPESSSVENVSWSPIVPCMDHKYRLHDIEEHLHNGIDLGSKKTLAVTPTVQPLGLTVPSISQFRRGSASAYDSSTALNRRDSVLDSTKNVSGIQLKEAQANASTAPKVRFVEAPASIHRYDPSVPRKWRRPSAIPPGFFNNVENAPSPQSQESLTSEEPCPTQESSHEFVHFDEPLAVDEPAGPTVLVNGTEVDNWDEILMDEQKPVHIKPGHERHFSTIFGLPSSHAPRSTSLSLNDLEAGLKSPVIDLRHKSYVDVYHVDESFDVHETCEHSTIARNWPTSRKRFTAFVACLNTACIGMLLGIYAGEVPAIQYAIADFGHYTILGNVLMYCGLAISTFMCWPLPLLHGRKPYMIVASTTALALQIPQGLAVNGYRDPSTITYKTLLLASRAVSGLALGLLEMNLKATLLDCFGASLQSRSFGEDIYNGYDVRKHGGGMGMWLGFVSWSTVGPISIGFMIGASIIDSGASVSWGFWIALCLLLVTLVFTIIAPEVRRAAFRRTIAQMTGQEGNFGRVSRGEVKMHLDAVGPYWWGEEVAAGLRLSGRMARQPGFLLLSLYAAWIYAQYSLVLMLLGSLSSKSYHYKAVWVGLCTLAPAFGAILAAPFQRASYFSRARITPARTDSFTVNTYFKWSSHFVRRLLFMILLPLCAAAYASTSLGPPLLIAAPCAMAGLVGFFTTIATAECYGLIMEAFDTTDLQPGMTGRPIRGSVNQETARQRTNFSCYPRVSAGFAITQTLAFLLAAAATAVCGTIQRMEGTIWTTTGVASISFVLTLVLTIVLVKWKKVQMIPNGPETAEHLRRAETSWRPVIVGRPSGKFRRLSIFELGRMTRCSQIRERNRVEGNLSGRGIWS